ncbi:uncharacterized protein LOC117101718, partial [Anneissia japonica]|uniref:uncharacterized protein LOC117101718 n=1 Tax=Anneissia japonica TaxID=1529436 RepID=UPI0014257A54
GELEMTNLQIIIFFIRSIYEHAVLLQGKGKIYKEKIAFPTISLIGTHKDLLPGSEAEQQSLIERVYGRIFEAIRGQPYESHVDTEMYAVDNTAASDEGIAKLKTNVGGFMNAMATRVPIKWVVFQNIIQEIGKTTLCMSLDKITKIASECLISQENVMHVLTYLNDIGIIFYSSTNKRLKNVVITNIHMLIGIFMKIITDVKPDGFDE